jgi:uncharacterized protein HemX
MIGLLIRAGLSREAAKGLLIALAIAAALFAFWWIRHDAYNDGVRDTDSKWTEAQHRLEQQAQQSAHAADQSAAVRVEQHDKAVAVEKERLEDAARNGSDPFDVLFGAGANGMR